MKRTLVYLLPATVFVAGILSHCSSAETTSDAGVDATTQDVTSVSFCGNMGGACCEGLTCHAELMCSGGICVVSTLASSTIPTSSTNSVSNASSQGGWSRLSRSRGSHDGGLSSGDGGLSSSDGGLSSSDGGLGSSDGGLSSNDGGLSSSSGKGSSSRKHSSSGTGASSAPSSSSGTGASSAPSSSSGAGSSSGLGYERCQRRWERGGLDVNQ